MSKFKNINSLYMLGIIAVICFFTVMDTNLFLSNLNNINQISIQDIVIYSIYGLNSAAKVTLMDIVRFSIPFILCLAYICAYLTDVIEYSNIYFNVIRYRSYKYWLRKHICKLILSVMLFFFIYYCLLAIISFIFTKNVAGFTDNFYLINQHIKNNNFIVLLVYQYFVSIFFTISLIFAVMFLSLELRSTDKSFIIFSSLILILSVLGKFNILNPMMISKQNIINYNFKMKPINIICIYVILIIIAYFTLDKYIKSLVRRNKL